MCSNAAQGLGLGFWSLCQDQACALDLPYGFGFGSSLCTFPPCQFSNQTRMDKTWHVLTSEPRVIYCFQFISMSRSSLCFRSSIGFLALDQVCTSPLCQFPHPTRMDETCWHVQMSVARGNAFSLFHASPQVLLVAGYGWWFYVFKFSVSIYLAGLCGKGWCRLRSLWCISLGHLSCGNDFLSRSKVMLKGGYTRKCLPKCFQCIRVVFGHLTVFITLSIVVCVWPVSGVCGYTGMLMPCPSTWRTVSWTNWRQLIAQWWNKRSLVKVMTWVSIPSKSDYFMNAQQFSGLDIFHENDDLRFCCRIDIPCAQACNRRPVFSYWMGNETAETLMLCYCPLVMLAIESGS